HRLWRGACRVVGGAGTRALTVAARLSTPQPSDLESKLPWALTSIFAAMKISVTLSVIGVGVAEIVAGRSGLGYLLLFASSRLDMGFSLAILLILAVWGGALFGAVALLERQTIYWHR